MSYTADDIASIIAPGAALPHPELPIKALLTDSRHLLSAADTLFFALPGPRRSGDAFVQDLYEKGVRNFVVATGFATVIDGANFFIVEDVLLALQKLAAYHRSRFQLPVIGITGSNGKTVVKEWLYQLLQQDYNIVRSPRSYNSQVGVPLSIWQLNEGHDLAIFEAGISQAGEMKQLAQIIQPTVGVFTNLGEAHSAGFISKEEKAKEKAILFETAAAVVCAKEYSNLFAQSTFTWCKESGCNMQVLQVIKKGGATQLELSYLEGQYTVHIPFTDDASIHNALTCCAVLFYLGKNPSDYQQSFAALHAVDMRLHLFQGINDCTIINDSYSADLTSLTAALNFLKQQQTGQQRTVILSDFLESSRDETALYGAIASSLVRYGVQKVIGIGERISTLLPDVLPSSIDAAFYPNTESFVQHFRSSVFQDEIILIKGARRAHFEKIAHLFEERVHQTVLQINLNAMVHNLQQYRGLLRPQTKVMAMVKAFSYGSGGAEIASVLQHNGVDYLGVAYTDEGVDLRREGISLPIMVINADSSSFDALIDYNLQPVIYSQDLLQRFEQYISEQGLSSWPVHLEVETGMNRLGFTASAIDAVASHIAQTGLLKIESLFSHLAASEDRDQDAFTSQQAMLFDEASEAVGKHLAYPFLKHLSNSAAIIRHAGLHYDMVRLGIGLYGVETVNRALELQPVATLRSTIAQLRILEPGQTVSYNRKGIIDQPSLIATVRIGYADGYPRRLSNGLGKMWVRGSMAPVIGSVCMDMTMIDVTGIDGVQEGDEVILFGKEIPVQQVAQWAGTIPYEIMTGISQRVKRVWHQE